MFIDNNNYFIFEDKDKEKLENYIKNPDFDFKKVKLKISNLSSLFKEFQFDKEKIKKNGLQDISNWDICKIKNMRYLFYKSNFDGNISDWDVNNVEDMEGMFMYSDFNQNISKWNVNNVKNMNHMFYESKFNQDISNWNVSNVEDMGNMFTNSNFNQDISNWDISNVKNMIRMFYNSKFSFIDEILEKWSKIINPNCKIKDMFLDSKIQKEFEIRIKRYQKLKCLLKNDKIK